MMHPKPDLLGHQIYLISISTGRFGGLQNTRASNTRWKPPSDVSWFIHPINNSAIGQPSYRTGASMELRKWLVIISSKKWPAMKNHVFQKMLYVFLWWFLIVGVSIVCLWLCFNIIMCFKRIIDSWSFSGGSPLPCVIQGRSRHPRRGEMGW